MMFAIKFSIAVLFLGQVCSVALNKKDLAKIDPRIIGGKIATLGQFPFAAYLQVNFEDGEPEFCGGSLLKDQWILTAAQCLDETSGRIESVTVELGKIDLESKTGVLLHSTTFKIHEKYDNVTFAHDVGLIKLPQKMQSAGNIKSIELASETISTPIDVTAVGWGLTKDGGTGSQYLNYVNIKTISNEKCNSNFSDISDSSVCCQGSGTEGICDGDSGGALIQKNSDGKYIHVGITSFGIKSCETNIPRGFARTFEHLDWIRENSGASKTIILNVILLISIFIFQLF